VRSLVLRVITLFVLAGSFVVPATAGAKARTVVTVFHAFTAAGAAMLPSTPESGYCWAGSLAADRSDAWRCATWNAIYDPCFSSKAAAGIVLCPIDGVSRDIEISLTRRLPTAQGDHGKASAQSEPWLIELAVSSGSVPGGVFCELSTGASLVVDGVRLNYYCTGGAFSAMGLWGLPTRKTPEWSIRITSTSAKAVAPKVIAKTLAHARHGAIRHVWM
jgi:hypothetical protein